MKEQDEKTVKLIFARHGETKYTQIAPDLTPDGLRQARELGEKLSPILRNATWEVRCSPTARARGTAETMLPGCEVVNETAIRPIDQYDVAAFMKLFASFGNHTHQDVGYDTDSRFEDGTIMEKRSQVQLRLWAYIADLCEKFAKNSAEMPDVIVHVTHYEVLWDLAKRVTGSNRVENCGFFIFDLTKVGEDVTVKVTFGAKHKEFTVRPPARLSASLLV